MTIITIDLNLKKRKKTKKKVALICIKKTTLLYAIECEFRASSDKII